MMSRGKEKVFALLLAAVITGSLCIGTNVSAQETGQEDEILTEELTRQMSESAERADESTERADESTEQTDESSEQTGESAEQTDESAEQLQKEISDGGINVKKVQVEKLAEQTEKSTTSDSTISGVCGDDLTWELKDGVLTISGTGAMQNDDVPWGSVREQITKVNIGEYVTSIGGYAFSHCSNLKSISIPNGVKSIGYDAFCGCSSLTSISIPGSVTSIGVYAFLDCRSLTNISISDGVTCIEGGAFSYCSSLTSINIPDSVTNISADMLSYCSSLTSISIPGSVTKIGNRAFQNCNNLSKISIPNSVTSIGNRVFQNCSSLASISIPESVTGIGYETFQNCSSLKQIEILNKSCEIHDGENTISATAVIYGYPGSTAQAYANKYGRKFIVLDGKTEVVNDEKNTKVEKITITGISKKIAAGRKVKLTANILPSNATNKGIIWKSSNTKYATVSNNGVVTMKKAGKGKMVVITATAKDGSGKKASYKIKSMKGVVKKVVISGKNKRALKAGKSLKLTAKVTASGGANKALKWTSSSTKYAVVNGKGKVTAKKAGKGKTVTITAKATDGSGKKKSVKIKIN